MACVGTFAREGACGQWCGVGLAVPVDIEGGEGAGEWWRNEGDDRNAVVIISISAGGGGDVPVLAMPLHIPTNSCLLSSSLSSSSVRVSCLERKV